MYKTKKNSWQIVVTVVLMIALFSCIFAPQRGIANAKVESLSAGTHYCEDDILFSENGITPYGIGITTVDDQVIQYDYKQIIDDHTVWTAPSYGNTDNTMSNLCGPMAGTNIMGFYDRYYPNLIANFNPGMINSGRYQYFPNLKFPAVKATTRSLYTAMGTNTVELGTSQRDFQSGLNSYVNGSGYNISYSSFYQNTKTVNLNILAAAISNNKVGVIFCNTFNYVYSISDAPSGIETTVNKNNSTAAHIMMVYGYQTIAYYKNGVNFLTDTYLQVSSGFSTADQGYIEMDDYLKIEDALIINIS